MNERVPGTEETDFEELLRFLKEQRGFDFTGYKRPSLMRRVRRQMDVAGIAGFAEYHDFLVRNPSAFAALSNAVLINVTGFFRDTEAWQYLRETVLPRLVASREDQPIRVWSAGCSSGQEAYSLAMAFAEAMGMEQCAEMVRIYATDVDEGALAHARRASFSGRDMEGVPPDLVAKYFQTVDMQKKVRPELQQTLVFGRNDLLHDAPISHCDLLVCRNTLMYFGAQAQATILDRLNFALKPDGVLFLGKAEMLLSHRDLFEPIELTRRFFRKVSTGAGSSFRVPGDIPAVRQP
jgi:two-component system CheB/CheR fusion protein